MVRPLLILLPGLDGTGKRFADFIRVLMPGIDTQIVSYPTDLPLGYAELERRVCDELPGDRSFVLLGESFSGPIAIRIAVAPPPGLKGVILLWGTPQRARAPANSERAVAAVADPVVRRRVAELLACNVSADVKRIELPMMILHGRADRLVSLRAARRIQANARAAELVEIDGPHLLLQSRATECAGPVSEFVRRCVIE